MGIFSDKSSDALRGRRIAILATEGVEEAELLKPQQAIKDAGGAVDVISPEKGMHGSSIKSWDMTDWGKTIDVDVELSKAKPDTYDALVLPGGAMNPDKLRMAPEAVAFVQSFVTQGKPIAAICHASWTLIETGAVRGKTMTSWPSLQTDLRNAGANWVDQEVVVDGNLITSRKPDDLPAFNEKLIEVFSKARSTTSV